MDNEILQYERDHLSSVRTWMENYMREKTPELEELIELTETEFKKAGGTYSQEYENTYNARQILGKRLENLEESKEKPYFGRVDFREKLKTEKDSLYIGKHAVRDPEGTMELVIDWRAPVADLYYSATLGRTEYKAPMGFIEGDFTLKRRFTYTKDETPVIDRYFDEGDQIIVAQADGEGRALDDEFLRITLDEASGEKLKEIVATIAREQNEIIRAEKNIPIIVQGSAGAGKTTVALHRLSYLLYKHRETLKDSEVCIVAPNTLFIDYISEVLPDLGSSAVVHTTLENLILKELKIKSFSENKDEILRSLLEDGEEGRIAGEISRIKGSREFLGVLRMMGERLERMYMSSSSIALDGETLYSEEELKRLYTKDLSHLNLKERKEIMETYCLKNIKDRTSEVSTAIDRKYDRKIKVIKNIYEGNEAELRKKIRETYSERDEILKRLPALSKKAVKDYFKASEIKDVAGVYRTLLEDRDFMEEAFRVNGIDTEPAVMERLTRNSGRNIPSDDLPAVMYLKILLKGVETRFSHMVVDEAQDYSYVQLEIMRQMTRQDSMTLVGDLAQGIYSYRAIRNWNEAASLFSGGTTYRRLNQSYRSTIEIIQEANRTLRRMDLDIDEALPVLRHGPVPERITIPAKDTKKTVETIDRILKDVENQGRKTVALVTRTGMEAMELHRQIRKHHPEFTLIDEKSEKESLTSVIIPSYMTKGLEFDCVVLMDEGSFGDNPLDLRLKYVSLTRALHLEYIISREG